MKCNNCQNEILENSSYCTNCGNPINNVQSSTKQKLLSIFNDSLFLAICILITVSTGISCLVGSFSVLHILFTVFLWLIFSAAKKGKVDDDKMRCVSGTIYASYIISWIGIVILSVCSVAGIVFSSILGGSALAKKLISEIIADSDSIRIILDKFSSQPSLSLSIILSVICVVLLLISVIATIFNICGTGNIHKFAKSLYLSAQTDTYNIHKLSAAKNWLLVFGILEAISALGSILNIFSFFISGTLAAAYIIAYILVRKYFLQEVI